MNAIITGGTRGIGKETAMFLAGIHGCRVIVTGRNADSLGTVAGLEKSGRIIPYRLVLPSDQAGLSAFHDFVAMEFGSIDILINNAATLVNKDFMKYSEADIRQIIDINFTAQVFLIQKLAPLMKKGSHIVNISSMGGFQGSSKFRGLSVYSASKAAMASLTECLAVELADKGISVNCIAPGSVDTEMLREAFPGYRAQVSAAEMGRYIADFAVKSGKLINGRIIPVSSSNP